VTTPPVPQPAPEQQPSAPAAPAAAPSAAAGPHGQAGAPYGQVPGAPHGQVPGAPHGQAPGAPYAQPGYGPGYGQPAFTPEPAPGSPWAVAPTAAPGARRRNPAGLIAAILVGVCIVLQIVQSVSGAAMFASRDFDNTFYAAVQGVFAVLQSIIALTAVILGGIGVAGRDKPKALAGVGLGGGAVVLFGVLTSYLMTALISAFAY
jgi:hypothetical protein